MNLNNYYWFCKSAIPSRLCDLIVKQAKSRAKDKKQAVTGNDSWEKPYKNKSLSKKELFNLKKKRDSNVIWMDDRWIYNEIHPFIKKANLDTGWNFQWDWSESCQFTIYKKDQYYDWHCDSWAKPYENGKIRKLSVTVSLSDPKDYKGGELEFDFRNQDPDVPSARKICTEILPKGSLVVFPSFVWHRVKPVTKGLRHSLVVWNLGYPFK